MKVVKSFTDKNKNKGKIGSVVRILEETMYLKENEIREVSEIISHGGNGTYLKFKDSESPFASIKATTVEIVNQIK